MRHRLINLAQCTVRPPDARHGPRCHGRVHKADCKLKINQNAELCSLSSINKWLCDPRESISFTGINEIMRNLKFSRHILFTSSVSNRPLHKFTNLFFFSFNNVIVRVGFAFLADLFWVLSSGPSFAHVPVLYSKACESFLSSTYVRLCSSDSQPVYLRLYHSLCVRLCLSACLLIFVDIFYP